MSNTNKEEARGRHTISPLVIELHPDQLQKSYQEAINTIKQAKILEGEGKEELAKDAYFQAAETIKNLKRDFQWGVENKRLVLERERIEFEKLAKIIPSSSTLDDLFSQVTSGLQGRMEDFYEGHERDAWNKKQEEERERHRQSYYLIDKHLNPNKTSEVTDKLQGIEWLTLEYYKDYPLSLNQREDIQEFYSAQESNLQTQLKTMLLKGLNIPPEFFVSYDLEVNINFYKTPASIITEEEAFDIMEKENVRMKLDFKDKKGSDIVEFGFSYANAFDPEIERLMRPYDLLQLEHEQEGYKLKIYNPKYKSKIGWDISSNPELAEKADRRAKEIVKRLEEVI